MSKSLSLLKSLEDADTLHLRDIPRHPALMACRSILSPMNAMNPKYMKARKQRTHAAGARKDPWGDPERYHMATSRERTKIL